MAVMTDLILERFELRKQQLDNVVEAYKVFRQRLSELPPSMVAEVEELLRGECVKHDVDTTDYLSRDAEFAGKTSSECIDIIMHERKPVDFGKLS